MVVVGAGVGSVTPDPLLGTMPGMIEVKSDTTEDNKLPSDSDSDFVSEVGMGRLSVVVGVVVEAVVPSAVVIPTIIPEVGSDGSEPLDVGMMSLVCVG